jgi:hypothetical protein
LVSANVDIYPRLGNATWDFACAPRPRFERGTYCLGEHFTVALASMNPSSTTVQRPLVTARDRSFPLVMARMWHAGGGSAGPCRYELPGTHDNQTPT